MKIEFIDYMSADFSQVMAIRNAVFENEQGAIPEQELDEYDSSAQTVYALAFENGKAIATGRIAKIPDGFKIGRIAVTKQCRGKGVGKDLVTALCDKAIQMGAKEIYVDSQLHAVGFYEGLGFKLISNNEIIDRGIKHLPMIRK
ncbi:MAG: GNAT family N-acetyltransferase [Eubacterium sp.]